MVYLMIYYALIYANTSVRIVIIFASNSGKINISLRKFASQIHSTQLLYATFFQVGSWKLSSSKLLRMYQ